MEKGSAMIAVTKEQPREALTKVLNPVEIRARAARIRREWSREERTRRMLQARFCQHKLLGALLFDAA